MKRKDKKTLHTPHYTINSEYYDVLVIGSGVSGLTAALLFAKDGKKVAVTEQAAHIAPLLSGFDRKVCGKTAHFETGFHYSSGFGEAEIGTKLLKELGIDIPFEPCSADNYDEIRLFDGKKVFKTPVSRNEFEKRLSELFPQEKDNIKKYFDLVENIIKNDPFFNALAFKDILSFSDDGRTLREVLDSYFANEELKALLSYSCSLHGTPPSKVPFMLHCCCVGLMAGSVWKIKGGARTLVEAYRLALQKYGVNVFTGKKAVKIENNENKKKVYFEDNTEIECGMCVSSVHPKEFIKIAPDGVYRKNGYERIKNIEETPSFFVLYGVLRGGKKYECTNIAFLDEKNYGCDLYKEDIRPAYINFSDTDPQSVCVVAFVKPDEDFWDIKSDGYQEKKAEIAKKIKEKFALMAPEIASRIEYCDTATPATFKKYLDYYSGYGIMHDISGTTVLPVTKVPGLFLTGQAVVTPGILGAMISSFLLYKIIERGNNGN